MSLHDSLIFFSHITIIPDDIRRMPLVPVYANQGLKKIKNKNRFTPSRIDILTFLFLRSSCIIIVPKPVNTVIFVFIYNPKSEKVGTVWKTQIKKESSDF